MTNFEQLLIDIVHKMKILHPENCQSSNLTHTENSIHLTTSYKQERQNL